MKRRIWLGLALALVIILGLVSIKKASRSSSVVGRQPMGSGPVFGFALLLASIFP